MLGACFNLRPPLSNALSVVELRVHMDCDQWRRQHGALGSYPQIENPGYATDCDGCEKRIRRAISKLHGVDSVEIDMEKQKVTVRGHVERGRVLKAVRRSGRKAEFWAFPYDSEYHPYAATYLDESTFTSSYNYDVHGYNEPVHGYFPDLPYSTIDDRITYRFSDENVHACSIM